jgi:hypothetical protein
VLLGPSPSPLGGDAFVLVSAAAPRPVAMVVKEKPTNGTVVEVPHAIGDGMRDVGLRLSNAMRADVLLLGLEHGGAARGGAAMRLMHAIASTHDSQVSSEPAGPPIAPRVVLLRPAPEAESNFGVVGVGAWGGPARGALATDVKSALGSLGVASTDRPLDLAVREMGARAIFGDVPVVAAIVDTTAVRELSLDEARGTAKVITAGIASLDGDLGAAATKLAQTIADSTPEPTVAVLDLGKQVALEQSVVARRNLASAVASSAARAAIVHTELGDFFLVVTKSKGGFVAAATSIDPNAKKANGPVVPSTKRVPKLVECASTLVASGTCRAEGL